MVVDLLHPFKNLLQRLLCCRARDRLAAVGEERLRPGWVTFHAFLPAASISPSANRALIGARPFRGCTEAADSTSPSPQGGRVRSCRNVQRTSRAGQPATIPLGSIRVWL